MAESKKVGCYTRDTGTYVRHFYMGAEPPEKQFMLHGKAWEPLTDPWYLMDLVMTAHRT